MTRENSSVSHQFFEISGFGSTLTLRTKLECFDDTVQQNCTEVPHFPFWKTKILVLISLAGTWSHHILDIFQVKNLTCFTGKVLISSRSNCRASFKTRTKQQTVSKSEPIKAQCAKKSVVRVLDKNQLNLEVPLVWPRQLSVLSCLCRNTNTPTPKHCSIIY